MSKDKNLSMFFNRTLTQKDTDFLSLYFEQDHWGMLFELVKEYESFQLLKKSADSFLLKIGKYEFNVVRDFHKCIITMGQISTLTKGAAELLCKIADLLFYDRKNRFSIDTENLSYEEVAWDACFHCQIPIKPKNKAQAERFLRFAQRKNIQVKMTTLGFSQAVGNDDSPKNEGKTGA